MDDEQPEFGPGGYLPDRASRRARKIVLRAPMGLQWIVGSLVIGLVILAVGAFALGRDTTPEPPFVPMGAAVADRAPVITITTNGVSVLVLTAGGRPRVFDPAVGDMQWCEASGLFEAPDGRAWRPTGRGVGGTPSLLELPTVIHEGELWVDPTRTLPPATPSDTPVELACS